MFVFDEVFVLVVVVFSCVLCDLGEVFVIFLLFEVLFWWCFLDCFILLLCSCEVRYVIVFDFFLSFFIIVVKLVFFFDIFLIYFWFNVLSWFLRIIIFLFFILMIFLSLIFLVFNLVSIFCDLFNGCLIWVDNKKKYNVIFVVVNMNRLKYINII